MLNYMYNNLLNRKQKNRVKKTYYKINRIITDTFFSYDKSQLKTDLLHIGIKEGDTLLVHSSFNNFNGFKGRAQDIIECLIELFGKEKNVLMVSLP